MKLKELTTIGFKPTPKKDYYYYIQDHFYLLLQVYGMYLKIPVKQKYTELNLVITKRVLVLSAKTVKMK